MKSLGGLRVNRWHLLKFVAVGSFCFMLQLVVMDQLHGRGVRLFLANAAGFALSAQVNFVLSRYITWHDRRVISTMRVGRQWLEFLATMLTALVLNTTVFSLADQLLPRWMAAAAGVGAGTVLTFLMSALRVFAVSKQDGALIELVLNIELEGLEFQPYGQRRPGAAVVMPAFKERHNLSGMVRGVLEAAELAQIPCTVVVATDGGPDGTPELASDLVREFSGRMVAAHHRDQDGNPLNQGYGRAVRTALDAGLKTGHEHVILVDSDSQFPADDLMRACQHALDEQLHVVFGYRIKRADPLKRRMMGRAWTWFSRLWTRYWVRDVDCAVKVFAAHILEQFELCGNYGAIGPELVAWSAALSDNIGQVGVRHLPRADQELQTGANLNVVLGSFRSVASVYANLVRHGLRWGRLRRVITGSPAVNATSTTRQETA